MWAASCSPFACPAPFPPSASLLADHRRALAGPVPTGPSWRVDGYVLDERRCDPCIALVASRDSGVGDDLAVGIGSDIAFPAVEGMGLDLAAVAHPGVGGGDGAVLGDFVDVRKVPSSPVSRSSPSTLANSSATSLTAGASWRLEGGQSGIGVLGTDDDEALTCLFVVPVPL